MIVAGKRITGIIFDADGTLLDSMGIWENVANEFLELRGIHPKEDLAVTFKTMSLEESAEYYQNKYGVKETKQEIIEAVSGLSAQAYRSTIPLKPGAKEILAWGRRQQIPMCIATATDKKLLESALSRLGMLQYFDTIVTCEEVGHSKEHADIYEEARKRIRTERESTLVVEDATHAARTAKKAGFVVLGVYDAAEEEKDQLITLADYYVTSLLEIGGIIYEENTDDCGLRL